MAFLRAAFAPVDFPQLAVEGVPDNYTGPSVVKQHSYVTQISLPAASHLNIAVLPTPGHAFWYTTTDTGSNWSANNYGDYGSCFPTVRGDSGSVFSRFRYIGQCIELRPTSAVVSNAGMITAARVPITVVNRALRDEDCINFPSALGTMVRYVDMSPASSDGYTQGACYTSHVNDGLYSVALNDGNWQFEDTWTGEAAVPPLQVRDTLGATHDFNAKNGRLAPGSASPLMGFGHLNAIAIKVTNDASTPLTFTVICRAIIEYIPDPYSIVYNMARPSPPHDVMALDAYSDVCSTLPPGVPYSQNADFWEKVWNFLRGALSGASKVAPAFGPYGALAGGVSDSVLKLGDALHQLRMGK
jgi:hypothetical protein